LRQEPSKENRGLALANDLTNVEISMSAVARNTLLFLKGASVGDGLKLTATGNLLGGLQSNETSKYSSQDSATDTFFA
jgi:hypothetical protein